MTAACPATEKSRLEVLLETISASRLNSFHSCRLKFYFRYVLEIPKPTSAAQFLGRAVHGALQRWSNARWRGQPQDVESLKTSLVLDWASAQATEPVEWESLLEEHEQQEKAWGLVEMYLRETPIAPNEKPEAVEARVEADLPGLPRLVGVIDLVRPGGRIVDFKTTAATPQHDQAIHRNETQLTAYGLLHREATGKDASGFELHHLVKTKTPKLVITTHDPVDMKQESKLFRSIESYVDGVEREDWVASPGLQCVACEFFHECKGGAL
jgi:putative RecB family exonuclease